MADTQARLCLNIISALEEYIAMLYLDPCSMTGVVGVGLNGDLVASASGLCVNSGHGTQNIIIYASICTAIKNYLCSISNGVKYLMSNYNKVQNQIKLLEIKLNKFKLYEQEIRSTDSQNTIRIDDCVNSQFKLTEMIAYWRAKLPS